VKYVYEALVEWCW